MPMPMPKPKMTMGELYNRTMKRHAMVEGLGFTVDEKTSHGGGGHDLHSNRVQSGVPDLHCQTCIARHAVGRLS